MLLAYKGQDSGSYIPQVQAVKGTLYAEDFKIIIKQNKIYLPFILTMRWQL